MSNIPLIIFLKFWESVYYCKFPATRTEIIIMYKINYFHGSLHISMDDVSSV